ncbi:DUF6587 family protein [Duganella qianjiadongensis]|uniref:FeoB-associated Cys-rich membrane protein n=1 Tax=Duganella qianjiadongensis TaxID=2692176 RepID=A0ABW9VRN6_9BURK|nr:DUF6587 family protein [Duganella qianjiadongensis]MYM40472.1 hypothetical protein [Duganella qianjiadongensis]
MLQNLIVVLIVVLALLHFCRRYLPAALRRRWADALVRRGVDGRLLARLFGLREGCGDGCSSCGGCDSGPQGKDGGSAGSGSSGAAGKPAARVIMLHVQR